MRRAPAWVQEVAALAELVDTHVGMTEQELAILFGLSVTTIRERLKLALLPPGIRSQVTGGTVGYAVARRITRLTEVATSLLEDQAQEGEVITWRRRTRVLQLAHGARLVHLVTEPDLLNPLALAEALPEAVQHQIALRCCPWMG